MTTLVAIIGGGCAGLGAARELLRKGKKDIEVVLIEAFDRLGGRAWTVTDGGFPFDLGPQFIQDPGINPWKDIAADLNIGTVPSNPSTVYRLLGEAGWRDAVPGKDEPKRIVEVRNLLQLAYKDATKWSNKPPLAQSLGTDAEAQIALGSEAEGSIAESAEPWQYIASDRARQKDVADEDAGIEYVKGGLGTLVESFGAWLQKKFDPLLKVLTGQVVTCIRWMPTDQKLEITAGYKPLLIADYCIVTVPCSALPRIAFIPPLDQKRVVANAYIVLGSYKKVAFCPQPMPKEIEPDHQYFVFDYRMQGCWQYFRLPTAPEALIGVASGNFAARLDRLNDETAAGCFTDALTAAYPKSPFAPKTKPLVTNWSNQPNVWGAYSYTRYDGGDPDNPTAFNAREQIGKSHVDGHILFAGEATWTDAYGTIHGAYRSGERAARTILKQLGLS